MKYCSYCGAEMDNDAEICIKCGCPDRSAQLTCGNTVSNSWSTLSIVGFVFSFLTINVGFILSLIAYLRTKRTGQKGRGFAVAGIIITVVEAVVCILFWLLVIWLGYIIERNGGM